jgi:predicted MFS family arabinose efflux permease
MRSRLAWRPVSARFPGRTFRSLAEPNYRRYFLGHTCSIVGTWVQRIGQDWLVLELTGSAVALGGALLCQFLPVLLGGMWGGVVVDRLDTRRLLMSTQAVSALTAAALAAFAISGTASLAIVYILAAVLGVVTVVDSPARQVFVAELVGEHDVVNAQALNSLVTSVGRLVGPALAGLVIATAGVGITFVINAVSFVAVLVGLVAIDRRTLRPAPRPGGGPGQAREGLRYIWRHSEMRAVVVLVAVISVFGQNFRVVFPLLATDVFGGGAQAYGWMTATLGLGAVLGALLNAAAEGPTSSWRLVLVCLAFGVTSVLVAAAPSLAFALLAVAGMGMASIVFNTLARALLLTNSSPEMRGRVMAIHTLVFLGGVPVGGPLIGVMCELWGARAGMSIAALACLLGAGAVLPRLRGLRTRRSQARPQA